MKVAHIEYGFSYPPVGGEQLRVNEVCQLLLRKFDIKLFYPSTRKVKEIPPFENESFEYVHKETRKGRIFWREKRIVEQIENKLKRFNPDIIHHHFGSMPSLINAVIAGKGICVPQVATFHQFWPLCYRGTYWDFEGRVCNDKNVCGKCMLTLPCISKLMNYRWQKIVKCLLSSIAHFITYSKFMKEKMERAGVEKDNISVIPYGVDFQNIPGEKFKRQ